ncbi:hypothetical protein [Dysgonomonas sp. 25]|uniref:hypothetical protein n=1 Tax=Dysgonomonas sp. 25 TaxID=2302933 RepID=UPI0013D1DD43|nr:hypothetical protein [Dysgonomonas sp. 25]
MLKIENCLDRVASARRTHFWMFLGGLLLLTAIMMFLNPLFPGHDFYFHMTRFDALIEALQDGRYPVYIDWKSVNEYGYLNNAFYCDLLLVPFAIIAIFTNSIFAYKVMIFVITVLTGLFTYHAVSVIIRNNYVAAIGAILYTFSYYRLLDLYPRAALGETLSFAFVPFVALGLYYIISGDYRKWYVIALGYSLLIFTHVISTVLTFITMIIVMAICYKSFVREPKRLAYLCLAGVVAVLVTAYYLFPMLEQMASNTFYYTVKPVSDIRFKLNGPYVITQGLFTGIIYSDKFIAGTGVILTWAVSMRLFVYEKTKQLKIVDIGVIIGLVYIFVTSIFFPWGIFPFSKLGFIQFPWRFFQFTTLFFAVAGAYYFSCLKTKKRAFAMGSIAVVFTIAMLYFYGRHYTNNQQQDVTVPQASAENFYNLQGIEYLPEQFLSIWYAEVRGNQADAGNEDTQIGDIKKEHGITTCEVLVNRPDIIELPLTYYKGYSATVDGKAAEVTESWRGLVQLPVEQSGQIEVKYTGTTIQNVSPYITLISVIGLCIYIIISRRRKPLKQAGNA